MAAIPALERDDSPVLDRYEALVRAEADRTMAAHGETVNYRVGTMIEVPRAALLADEIAEVRFLRNRAFYVWRGQHLVHLNL